MLWQQYTITAQRTDAEMQAKLALTERGPSCNQQDHCSDRNRCNAPYLVFYHADWLEYRTQGVVL